MRHLATLWIGGDLGPMEVASLNSMLRSGHSVTLYSYSPVGNVPSGVKCEDASRIMSGERILVYSNKLKPSPALHANLFRYAMLKQTDAVWVDLDIIMLRPMPQGDYIMGFETDNSVNNAVLRLPVDSPTLTDLLEFTPETVGVAPHITGLRRLKYWVRTFGRGYPIERWAWGSTGPKALTIALNKHGELRHAHPKAAFYPVDVHDHHKFLEPSGLSLGDFGEETIALHLWGSRIRATLLERYGGVVPGGSLYAQILDTYR